MLVDAARQAEIVGQGAAPVHHLFAARQIHLHRLAGPNASQQDPLLDRPHEQGTGTALRVVAVNQVLEGLSRQRARPQGGRAGQRLERQHEAGRHEPEQGRGEDQGEPAVQAQQKSLRHRSRAVTSAEVSMRCLRCATSCSAPVVRQ
jgi:hypothetical protein